MTEPTTEPDDLWCQVNIRLRHSMGAAIRQAADDGGLTRDAWVRLALESALATPAGTRVKPGHEPVRMQPGQPSGPPRPAVTPASPALQALGQFGRYYRAAQPPTPKPGPACR